jgi:hypothetical protein
MNVERTYMNQKRTRAGSEKPTGIKENPWGSIRTSMNKRELAWAHKNLQESKRVLWIQKNPTSSRRESLWVRNLKKINNIF